jgi:hypothetical protein
VTTPDVPVIGWLGRLLLPALFAAVLGVGVTISQQLSSLWSKVDVLQSTLTLRLDVGAATLADHEARLRLLEHR